MARAYAFTEIRRGNDDGSVDVFPVGTDVTSEFSKEQLQQFLAQGTVATYDRTKSADDLADEAAEAGERERLLKERIRQLEIEKEELQTLAQDRAARVADLTEDAEAKQVRTENPDGTVEVKDKPETKDPEPSGNQTPEKPPSNEPK